MLTSFSSGQVFGERQGRERATVVALHGWARDRRDFSEALKGLDSLSLDLPGFGLSPVPHEPWDTTKYAECVLEVLQELDAPPVLVGHSFGGRVAVRLAALHPRFVAGLVLTGVPLIRRPSRSSSPGVYRVIKALHTRGIVNQKVMARVRSHYGSSDYNNAVGVMRDVLVRVVNESYERELRELQCPIRLIWGANDTAAPVWIAQEASLVAPRAELTVLDGVGHFVPLQAPAAIREAVGQLLHGRE